MPRKEQSLDSIQRRQDTYDNKWGKYKLHKKHCKDCKKTFRWAGREKTKGYRNAMFNKKQKTNNTDIHKRKKYLLNTTKRRIM